LLFPASSLPLVIIYLTMPNYAMEPTHFPQDDRNNDDLTIPPTFPSKLMPPIFPASEGKNTSI
ncbi:MAG TPA: hypothetical protein VGO47_01410, partial [Chlamydiales bacterium]|nr:hypothetical protein [Chlamydiales bacterium]